MSSTTSSPSAGKGRDAEGKASVETPPSFDPKPLYLTVALGAAGFVLHSFGFITQWAMVAAVLLAYTQLYVSGAEYRGGCPSSSFRKNSWLLNGLSKWLRFKYVLSGCTAKDLEALEQTIVAIVPHGAGSLGHFVFGTGDTHDFWTKVLKKRDRRALAASVLFKIPVLREISLMVGCIDADKKSAVRALNMGLSLTVVPGGVMGQAYTRYGEAGMYVKKRKGFCKIALEHGCDIVPVYIFGETLLYWDIPILKPISIFLAKHLRIGIPAAFGSLFLLPFRPEKGMVAVIGKPIKVSKIPNPDWDRDVCPLHARYMAALESLYKANREAYGYAGKELFDFADEEAKSAATNERNSRTKKKKKKKA